MFSSIFSVSSDSDPKPANFHPVSSAFPSNDFFGELEPKDIEWKCAKGFTVETQTWYNFLEDGTFFTCQVIHSSVGVWFPTIQFTCKIYNPATKEMTWKSINVSNFVTPPPNLDKRSCKADEFSVTYKPNSGSDSPESYTIRANLSDDLQISLDVARAAGVPGWKIGKGPKGGFSYFGTDAAKPDGYVVHRFWPRDYATGTIIHKGQAITAKGPGMFVHAIQGMRPNLVASRWNFACFQSDQYGGVSAIQMEFTTTNAFGRNGGGSVVVNVGSVVVGGKLVAVTAETKWPDEEPTGGVVSRASHTKTALDEQTGYIAPTEISFRWAGPSLVPEAAGNVDATLQLVVGDPSAYRGLVEKVDVLAEIPFVIKKVVNYVAKAKPFIFQFFNPTTLDEYP